MFKNVRRKGIFS